MTIPTHWLAFKRHVESLNRPNFKLVNRNNTMQIQLTRAEVQVAIRNYCEMLINPEMGIAMTDFEFSNTRTEEGAMVTINLDKQVPEDPQAEILSEIQTHSPVLPTEAPAVEEPVQEQVEMPLPTPVEEPEPETPAEPVEEPVAAPVEAVATPVADRVQEATPAPTPAPTPTPVAVAPTPTPTPAPLTPAEIDFNSPVTTPTPVIQERPVVS